jgi:hypothetical protein
MGFHPLPQTLALMFHASSQRTMADQTMRRYHWIPIKMAHRIIATLTQSITTMTLHFSPR